jgi:hypothetical protein
MDLKGLSMSMLAGGKMKILQHLIDVGSHYFPEQVPPNSLASPSSSCSHFVSLFYIGGGVLLNQEVQYLRHKILI